MRRDHSRDGGGSGLSRRKEDSLEGRPTERGKQIAKKVACGVSQSRIIRNRGHRGKIEPDHDIVMFGGQNEKRNPKQGKERITV